MSLQPMAMWVAVALFIAGCAAAPGGASDAGDEPDTGAPSTDGAFEGEDIAGLDPDTDQVPDADQEAPPGDTVPADADGGPIEADTGVGNPDEVVQGDAGDPEGPDDAVNPIDPPDTDEPDPPPPECDGENPAGCVTAGCLDGQVCSLENGCAPTSCYCAAGNQWMCTQDCNGGFCVDDDTTSPTPSDSKCAEPNPASCLFVDCPEGFLCDADAPGCSPSSCNCISTPGGKGSWNCSKDCNPGQCLPDNAIPLLGKACPKPSPESCASTPCPLGQVCDKTAGCAPSSCACDTATGAWTCSDDCVDGLCVPATDDPEPKACPDDQVATGTQGCLTCEEAEAQVTTLSGQVLAGALSCTEDAECILVTGSTACWGTCPTAINGALEELYLSKMQWVSDDFCAEYPEKCEYMLPGCLPVEPLCIEEKCSAVAVLGTEGGAP